MYMKQINFVFVLGFIPKIYHYICVIILAPRMSAKGFLACSSFLECLKYCLAVS